MNKKLAAELLAMELGHRDLVRRLAADDGFGALQRLPKKWERKSPQLFGECVHMAAIEVAEEVR